MNKKNYASPLEQEVLFKLTKAEIISIGEIQDIFPHIAKRSLINTVSGLNKKGYLYRLKNGLYLVTPERALMIRDPLTIAVQIYPGYIGFGTALRCYDLMEYVPFDIFIVTNRKSRTKVLGEYTFRYVSMGRRATGAQVVNDIWVSNLEKTFFDCFYKPQYAGGYEIITKALYEKTEMDWSRFMFYLKEFASNALCQRIGYILFLLTSETKFSLSNDIENYLRSMVHSPTRLIPNGPPHGKYSKDWKLLDNVGKNRILGWWFNG